MERLSKEELDKYLGKKEAQKYYKDLEKLNFTRMLQNSFWEYAND